MFDLDGTLYVADKLIPGAVDAVASIREKYQVRYLTNTTSLSLEALHAKVKKFGFATKEDEVLNPGVAAKLFLRKQGSPKIFLVVEPEVATGFSDFDQVSDNPDYIVLGDYGTRWTYDLLNRIFKMLVSGSKLLALHRNKYWQTAEGLRLDIGIFVAGLEYVTDRKAMVLGKPSPDFYQLALENLGLPPEKVVMVGDDIEMDIAGAQKVGMKTVLVRTGKYREGLVAQSDVTPDVIIDSVVDLVSL